MITDACMKANKQSAPVFVWAPLGRCGTGLLQRLITSSGDVLMYGEDRFLTQSLPAQILMHNNIQQESLASTSALANGDYSNWSPNAFPDGKGYINLLFSCTYQLADLYRSDSQKYGFPRWGTKLPEINLTHLEVLKQLLPNGKHIFIHRNIGDVVRSSKARRWIKDLQTVLNCAQKWTNNMHATLAAAQELNLHVLRYEDLMADSTAECRKLQEFLGISPMDMTVFNHKVNTWPIDDKEHGLSATQYIEPEDLTDEELAILDRIPSSVLQQAGYQNPAARD